MSSVTGIQPIGAYSGVATRTAAVILLQSLIPNSDVDPSSGSGAVAGGGQGSLNTYLDEMSPACAVQLQVELAHILTDPVLAEAHGQYIVTAGDVTATFATPGLGMLAAPPILAKSAFSVRRAGALLATVLDAAWTIVGNNIRLASNGGYVLTAGDVITFYISSV